MAEAIVEFPGLASIELRVDALALPPDRAFNVTPEIAADRRQGKQTYSRPMARRSLAIAHHAVRCAGVDNASGQHCGSNERFQWRAGPGHDNNGQLVAIASTRTAFLPQTVVS